MRSNEHGLIIKKQKKKILINHWFKLIYVAKKLTSSYSWNQRYKLVGLWNPLYYNNNKTTIKQHLIKNDLIIIMKISKYFTCIAAVYIIWKY